MPFKGDVVVRRINPTTWRLVEPLPYKGKWEVFTVPAGFKTDFASVPRILTWLVPTYGRYTKSAILHDYLWRRRVVSRSDADAIFRRTMRELRVPFVRRWMMWAAVRAGSGLQGATLLEVIQWLLVTIPSVLLLFIPVIFVVLCLIAFWLLEFIFYLILKPFSRKRVNRPRVLNLPE